MSFESLTVFCPQSIQQNEASSRIRNDGFQGRSEISGKDSGVPVTLGGSIERNTGSITAYETELTGRKTYSQVVSGHDHIRIHANPDGRPLAGNVVDHEKCFSIKPVRSAEPFGVLLRLQVSRGWMKLTDPKPVGASDSFKKRLSKALNGTDPEDEYHREAFTLLLEHLVEVGLQSSDEKKYATLAACALRASPIDQGLFEPHYAQLRPRKLVLPLEDLEAVLMESPENAAKILSSHGVADEDVVALSVRKLRFEPHDGRYQDNLVGFIEKLSAKFEVTLRSEYFVLARRDQGFEIEVPEAFALEYTNDDGISAPREPSTGVEINVLRDGMEILFTGSDTKLLVQRRRGTLTGR